MRNAKQSFKVNIHRFLDENTVDLCMYHIPSAQVLHKNLLTNSKTKTFRTTTYFVDPFLYTHTLWRIKLFN